MGYKNAHLPEAVQQRLRDERRRARVAAKLFAAACQSGDIGQFYEAAEVLKNIVGGWTIAFQHVRQLESVPENIRHEFQLLWFEEDTLRSDDKHALFDALRVLFMPYHGSGVRLFRGAVAHEALARSFYRPSWSADIEKADEYARHKQIEFGGSLLLETLAPPEAIISAPGNNGIYLENMSGERLYNEREYIVDARRLQRVTVVRRYPQISFEERYPDYKRDSVGVAAGK